MNIMKLIIMRHGEAETSNTSDKMRNLTAHGWRQTSEAAKWLATHVIKNKQIDLALVSPYVRAQQSFESVSSVLTCKQKIDVAEFIPSAKAQQAHLVLDRLLSENPQAQSLIIVSHMPLICFLLDELLMTQQACLFDTSGLAIIDYNSQMSSGVLLEFYHPCMQQFELK